MKSALTKPISIFLLRWLKDPEKRHPCRLIRLTGRSTLRKTTSVSFNMVDREVNIAGFVVDRDINIAEKTTSLFGVFGVLGG